MRVLIAAVGIAAVSSTAAFAGDNGGRCSPKHLAGTWSATFEVVTDVAAVPPTTADVMCSFTVARDGTVASTDCTVPGLDPAVPFDLTGTISTKRSCALTGEFDFNGEVQASISGQLSHNRDIFVGAIVGEGWLKPVTAIRTAKSRGSKK